MDENNQGLQWSHIEPLCILRALARQLWMLLLAALTCAMAAWIVLTCFVTQQYTSSTTFSVTTRTSNLYYTNITAAADVAASYSQLLQSRVLRQTMEQNLGMPLNGTVSAQQLGETNLIRVTVTADTPRQALVLLKAVSDNYGSLSAHVSSTAVLSQLNSPSLSVAPSRSYNVPRIWVMAAIAVSSHGVRIDSNAYNTSIVLPPVFSHSCCNSRITPEMPTKAYTTVRMTWALSFPAILPPTTAPSRMHTLPTAA